MRATRATINLEQLRRNLDRLRRLLPPRVGTCLAVKAAAYGHGAVPVARAALRAGVTCLGVATVAEGVELRDAGISVPILLFSLPLPEEADAIVDARLTCLCADAALGRDLARAAARRNRTLEVHLKIDTGMGRIGCAPRAAPAVAQALRDQSGLRLTGVCTHFAVTDRDQNASRAQLATFTAAVEAIPGHRRLVRHAANSAAIAGLPAAHLDLVRPGILAYGYYPGDCQPRTVAVTPVMELATRVVFLKRVAAGTGISYGLTYRPRTATVIATLPVGYGDGYARALSNRAEVLIRGRRYPVVGSVCMDQCMVDLGPDPEVARYDRAVLFGPDPAGPSAADLARLVGSVPYEITCAVAARVPRVYLP